MATLPYTFAGQTGPIPTAQLDANFAALTGTGGIASNVIEEGPFSAGVDFTPGTTTTLTLSLGYGFPQNVMVHFDGAYQGPNTYTISGNNIIFNSPIPVGVSKVYVSGGILVASALPIANQSIVVQSVSAIRALLKTGAPTAIATGYHTQGDGGGGVYWYNAADTSSADNGGTIIVASDGGRWYLALTGWVSAKQFGAYGDNTHDDTTAIQAAVTWLIAQGGGTLYVPEGNYKTSATITLGAFVSVRGAGKLSSTFYPTTAVTGAVFAYLPSGLTTCGIVISDVGFSGNATTINALSFQNLTYLTLERIYFTGFTNAGQIHVALANCESSRIVGCMFMTLHGFGLNLTTNSNNCTINNNAFVTAAANTVGIQCDNTIQNTVIIGNDFEGASIGGEGINCSGTINTLIQGNYFEYWTAACIVANTGTAFNLAIRDNFMIATSAAAAYAILNSTGPNDQLSIENNFLDLLGNTGFSTIGFFLDNCTNVWARGNKSGGSSTEIIRINGSAWPEADYSSINGGIINNGNPVQTLFSSGTVAVDASLGSAFYINLTGNVTIANPINGKKGQTLQFSFVQAGSGGYTVGWGGSYARVVWSNAGNTVNLRASTQFFCIDGTNWVQVGAPQPWA